MPLSKRIPPQQPLLIAVVLLLGTSSLCLGQYPLSLREVFYHLTHFSGAEGITGQVIWTVRLPRIVMALLAGGALGLCGATLQGIFHNPLVDPHIIGVTSGAAFGGTLAILLGLSPWLMMGSTFFFGLTALILVYAIAALQGLENTLVLILSGIILSGFFAALVSLIQYQADTEETLPNIVFWLGRNGLGKSTLLDTLTGTRVALGGSIENEGGTGIVAQHCYHGRGHSIRSQTQKVLLRR